MLCCAWLEWVSLSWHRPDRDRYRLLAPTYHLRRTIVTSSQISGVTWEGFRKVREIFHIIRDQRIGLIFGSGHLSYRSGDAIGEVRL